MAPSTGACLALLVAMGALRCASAMRDATADGFLVVTTHNERASQPLSRSDPTNTTAGKVASLMQASRLECPELEAEQKCVDGAEIEVVGGFYMNTELCRQTCQQHGKGVDCCQLDKDEKACYLYSGSSIQSAGGRRVWAALCATSQDAERQRLLAEKRHRRKDKETRHREKEASSEKRLLDQVAIQRARLKLIHDQEKARKELRRAMGATAIVRELDVTREDFYDLNDAILDCRSASIPDGDEQLKKALRRLTDLQTDLRGRAVPVEMSTDANQKIPSDGLILFDKAKLDALRAAYRYAKGDTCRVWCPKQEQWVSAIVRKVEGNVVTVYYSIPKMNFKLEVRTLKIGQRELGPVVKWQSKLHLEEPTTTTKEEHAAQPMAAEGRPPPIGQESERVQARDRPPPPGRPSDTARGQADGQDAGTQTVDTNWKDVT